MVATNVGGQARVVAATETASQEALLCSSLKSGAGRMCASLHSSHQAIVFELVGLAQPHTDPMDDRGRCRRPVGAPFPTVTGICSLAAAKIMKQAGIGLEFWNGQSLGLRAQFNRIDLS